MSPDDFYLRYAGEIREALIMIEGDSGAFELLAHGALDAIAPEERLFAVVRSTESGAIRLLTQSEGAAPAGTPRWQEVPSEDLPQVPAFARAMLRRNPEPAG